MAPWPHLGPARGELVQGEQVVTLGAVGVIKDKTVRRVGLAALDLQEKGHRMEYHIASKDMRVGSEMDAACSGSSFCSA